MLAFCYMLNFHPGGMYWLHLRMLGWFYTLNEISWLRRLWLPGCQGSTQQHRFILHWVWSVYPFGYSVECVPITVDQNS